jgi:hypothetical protein
VPRGGQAVDQAWPSIGRGKEPRRVA